MSEVDELRAEVAALKAELETCRRKSEWQERRRVDQRNVGGRVRPLPAVAPLVAETGADLVAACRSVRQMRRLSHRVLDDMIGWADGYTSKIEQPQAPWGRTLTAPAFDDLTRALGVGFVAVELPPAGDPTLPLPLAIAPDAGCLALQPYSMQPEAIADVRGMLARAGIVAL